MDPIQAAFVIKKLFDRAKSGSTSGRPPTPLPILILAVFAGVFDLLFRTNFGERFFSPVRWVLSMAVIWAWMWVSRDSSMFGQYQGIGSFIGLGDGSASGLLLLILIFVGIAGGFNIWRIARRNKDGEAWYADNHGQSWLDRGDGTFYFAEHLPIKLTDWTIYKWVEGPVALLIAWLVSTLSVETGVLLALCAGSLLVRNLYEFATFRYAVLDAVNDQIVRLHMFASADEHDAAETYGYMPPEISAQMRAELAELQRQVNALERSQLSDPVTPESRFTATAAD